MQHVNSLAMHHTHSVVRNHFSLLCLTMILCTLFTGLNPVSPSSVCPLPLSPFSFPPFHQTLCSHRRIKQIVSFSSLLHTSPQHMSLLSLLLTALILFPPGPSASVPPLLPHLPCLIYYLPLPSPVRPNPFIPGVPSFLFTLSCGFFFFKQHHIMTWSSLWVRLRGKWRGTEIVSVTVKVIYNRRVTT